MAFLLCVGFCGYVVMRKVGRGVGCPLSGRYVTVAKTALGDKSRYRSGKDQCSGISNN